MAGPFFGWGYSPRRAVKTDLALSYLFLKGWDNIEYKNRASSFLKASQTRATAAASNGKAKALFGGWGVRSLSFQLFHGRLHGCPKSLHC